MSTNPIVASTPAPVTGTTCPDCGDDTRMYEVDLMRLHDDGLHTIGSTVFCICQTRPA